MLCLTFDQPIEIEHKGERIWLYPAVSRCGQRRIRIDAPRSFGVTRRFARRTPLETPGAQPPRKG